MRRTTAGPPGRRMARSCFRPNRPVACRASHQQAVRVQRGGYYGRYLRSGHLVYVYQGTVFAEPFDLARLEPTGPPVPVLDGVSAHPSISTGGNAPGGSAQVGWTETGAVAYFAGAGSA